MSETLSIRLPAEDKRALSELAARQGESVNAFVRTAIRRKIEDDAMRRSSPLSKFFRSVDVEVGEPTNEAVRRTMRKGAA